jgi:hypothetical protein
MNLWGSLRVGGNDRHGTGVGIEHHVLIVRVGLGISLADPTTLE